MSTYNQETQTDLSYNFCNNSDNLNLIPAIYCPVDEEQINSANKVKMRKKTTIAQQDANYFQEIYSNEIQFHNDVAYCLLQDSVDERGFIKKMLNKWFSLPNNWKRLSGLDNLHDESFKHELREA